MIESKRRYESRLLSFLMSWNVQFFLGFILCVIVAGLIVWEGNFSSWLHIEPRIYSLITMSMVYFFSYVSLRQFFNHLGFLNLRYVIPVVIMWTVFFYGILFVLRLSYSVYFLSFSTAFIIVFFWCLCYIRNHYGQFTVAYIAQGNLSNSQALPDVETIDWVGLTKPSEYVKDEGDIIIADLRANLNPDWEAFLADCTLKHIPVYHSSRFIESISGRVRIDHLYENELGSLLPSKGYLLTKRIIDVVLIFVSLPIVLPIMIIAALLIILESKGGALFIQKRIGQGGVPYKMYKFRSMYVNDDTQQTREGDKRITKIGRIIRKSRIDELPQFYNVLKGEMSLIGPRSEIPSFVEEYKLKIPFYNYRHVVKPGISGWAQVFHGYTSDVESTRIKLEYDLYYIKHFSFSMDLLIFFKTIQTIFTGFGAR